MRFVKILILAVLATSLLTGCIAPRSTYRPRLFGDTYQVKVEAAPIVTTAFESTPTVVMTTTTKGEGFIFNDMGQCALGAKFPPGWEYVAAIYYQNPPAELPSYAELTSYTDRAGQTFYEEWHPASSLILPPGYVSPKLRAPLGVTHYLAFTHTRTENGQGSRDITVTLPLANVQNVDVYKGKTCSGGRLCDWNYVQHTCFAR